ncbi:MAG: DUF2007 domain-containing protein [Planctomycetota bacterium]
MANEMAVLRRGYLNDVSLAVDQATLKDAGIDCYLYQEPEGAGAALYGIQPAEAYLVLVNAADRPAAEQALAAAAQEARAEEAEPPWRCAKCGETCDPQFTSCWKCGAARGAR